jgi:hypothetical protein
MKNSNLPHFTIKNRFQKKVILYSDFLTEDVLKDVCLIVTGKAHYTYEFDNEGYNIGRMAVLEYNGKKTYISFSETEANGRNSSFQSVPSALARYILDDIENKRMCFYFLPATGHIETDYFMFMYRLMMTAGIEFLNDQDFLTQKIQPFNTIADIIASRNANRGHNRSNNSTYITQSPKRITQIFGKTYGASKYETTLLCVALSHITTSQIELYQICEQDLSVLPALSQQAIESLGKVRLIPTDLTMERNEFEKTNSVRSPRYTYNLLAKLGPKKCAFCGCEIPELIQGAHIWPVADIKKEAGISFDDKLNYATDGDNGLWLCENHHKMLDENLLIIDEHGHAKYRDSLEEKSKDYIRRTTPNNILSTSVFTPGFVFYLHRRNSMTASV